MSSMPPLTLSQVDQRIYEIKLLGWMEGAIKDGLEWMRQETAYEGEPEVVKCLEGQWKAASGATLSKLHDNRLRKVAYDVASALTDVRPIWSYTSNREDFKKQADTFSKAARYWWRHTNGDEPLLEALMNSEQGGAGYLWQRWNPALPGGGDMELVALGVRDVMPVGPTYGKTVQEWQGLIVRQSVDMYALAQQYPTKREKIEGSTGQWFDPPATKGGGRSVVVTPFQMIARSVAMSGGPAGSGNRRGTCDLMIAFLKDYSVNTGPERVFMGKPDSWGYWVEPGAELYPRGRMVKFVQQAVLEDGPCEYWHGQFPLTRIRLLPFPKTLLGLSLLHDLIPLNDRLNEGLRMLDDGIGQWARRAVVTNAHMPESKLKAMDPRAGGMKVRINQNAGETFEFRDGPTYPAWIMQYIDLLRSEIDDNSGSRGLRQLEQLKQMPAADTIEKFMDSLSPLLRIMARQVELALAEVAEQFVMNVMQFYTTPRRFQMLGEDGVSMEDFDLDPGTMVPVGKGDEGDTLEERAVAHKKNFIFSVQPNSFLSVSHTTKQLQSMQLFRSNALDPWSLWVDFDLIGVGKMPAETIAERLAEAKRQGIMPGVTPEVAGAQNQAMVLQMQMQIMQLTAQMGMLMGQAGGAPMGGPPAGDPNAAPPDSPNGAPRVNGVGPQGGRPPSGQAPPHYESKDGGTRTVVSES
jgi:hypothetical protein